MEKARDDTKKKLNYVVARFFFADPYSLVIPLKSRSDSEVMQSGIYYLEFGICLNFVDYIKDLY